MRSYGVFVEVPEAEATEGEEQVISTKFVDTYNVETGLRSRLCTRGYEATTSIEAEGKSLFAATPSIMAVRLMLWFAVFRSWSVAIADVTGAFLNASLEKPYYVKPPMAYRRPD